MILATLLLQGVATVAAASPPQTSATAAAVASAPAAARPAQRNAWNNPSPPYPTRSIEEGEAGTVRLKMHISAEGTVQAVALDSSSGYPRLDQAAMTAARTWRFIPAKRGGKAIPYIFIIPIEFSLKPAKS
ncbi:energy transducer TonB [Chromobacterium vaccinii]|nr:energy transducer TonB [Chromobacterium vaccinii]